MKILGSSPDACSCKRCQLSSVILIRSTTAMRFLRNQRNDNSKHIFVRQHLLACQSATYLV